MMHEGPLSLFSPHISHGIICSPFSRPGRPGRLGRGLALPCAHSPLGCGKQAFDTSLQCCTWRWRLVLWLSAFPRQMHSASEFRHYGRCGCRIGPRPIRDPCERRIHRRTLRSRPPSPFVQVRATHWRNVANSFAASRKQRFSHVVFVQAFCRMRRRRAPSLSKPPQAPPRPTASPLRPFSRDWLRSARAHRASSFARPCRN
jgi:hypothetical protein